MSNVIHLFAKRLIDDIDHSPKAAFDDEHQLSLPFSAPRTLYLLAGEIGASEDFYYFAAKCRVTALFDMRFSPRLDFIAPTRQKAFDAFGKIGLTYFDVLGRLGIESPSTALDDRVEILKDVIAATEKLTNHGEPCLMLFDHQLLAAEYARTTRQYFVVHIIDGKDMASASAECIKLQM